MESETERMKREHPLCTEEGLALFVGLLSYSGAMCPKCGHGTRRTSKRWAKCKKCGERVERRSLDSIQVSALPEHGDGN